MSVICDSCGFLGCDGACPEGYLYIIERKDDEIERLNSECDELMALVRRFRLGLGEVKS